LKKIGKKEGEAEDEDDGFETVSEGDSDDEDVEMKN
jgi:hypothetical protein